VLRVRGARGGVAAWNDIHAVRAAIAQQGGVPNFFGPQRFGSSVRPVTPRIGHAIVAGDLEEAVRLFVGEPYDTEPDEVRAARRTWDETRDAAAALALMPDRLDLERAILGRLARRPGEWRNALYALPHNLLQLFVHSWQSLLFNRIVSARIAAGLGLATAHAGDRVLTAGDDGTRTVEVTTTNVDRVQSELDRGRAFITAPLPGLDTPAAAGEPGALEDAVLKEAVIIPRAFRCRELPGLASHGRRRQLLMPVPDLAVTAQDGDPVFSFTLQRGAYATVVMREFQKADPSAY
jgi:tRNA pseudouridine13 synthase